MNIVYLNGSFIEGDKAKVSVLDRGFIFADGIYEVMPVYNRHIFRFDAHLQRMQNSLDAIHIKNPHTASEWHEILDVLVEKNNLLDASIYLQVTRGVAERDHVFSDDMEPTVFAMARPLSRNKTQSGVRAITSDDIRWKYCDIKSIALLPGVLLRYEACQKGAYEAILINDGFVTEGAASNVFIVKGETIKTPKKDRQLLPGITRDLVVELADKNDVPCLEVNIPESELKDADEIWITSSTQEIVPVLYLDDKKVGQGAIGPMWEKMNNIYQVFKQEFSGENL